jgi:antitoxin (DNA-binding transcriptional repressor) of toxin-antitoxin stability system
MPVARIVPYKASAMAERIPDLHPDAMVASDDFDEPLPDSFWTGSA